MSCASWASPSLATSLLPADSPAAIAEAAEMLRQGGLVAFPTDTVYGVGCHAYLVEAVARIYGVKGRAANKAIPLLLARAEDLGQVAHLIPPSAWRLAERFWPGGLTLVLPKGAQVPEVVTGGGGTVAVRVPNHTVALALIAAVGAPLAATSANRSGNPSPVTAAQVRQELSGRIEVILDGGPCPQGIPSTVLDITGDTPRLLRPGAVSRQDIEAALGMVVAEDPRRQERRF